MLRLALLIMMAAALEQELDASTRSADAAEAYALPPWVDGTAASAAAAELTATDARAGSPDSRAPPPGCWPKACCATRPGGSFSARCCARSQRRLRRSPRLEGGWPL